MLRLTNTEARLGGLGGLIHLTHLALAGLSYERAGLAVALPALAPQLLSLHLQVGGSDITDCKAVQHVSGWNTADLRNIGRLCARLQELRLTECAVGRSSSGEQAGQAVAGLTRLYPALTSLTVCSAVSPSQLLVLAGHASRLASLRTGPNCWLSARLLSRLIALNPLAELKRLQVDRPADLALPALFALLTTATRLETVVGVEHWDGLDTQSVAVSHHTGIKYSLAVQELHPTERHVRLGEPGSAACPSPALHRNRV